VPIARLIDANVRALQAVEPLLLRISDAQYCALIPPYAANVGQHLRHVADHYQLLLDGLNDAEAAFIDYDNRQRGEPEEAERSTMLLRLRQLCHRLQGLAGAAECALHVRLAVDAQPAPPVPSTLSRELLFVHGHTVHHYALIAAILKMQHIEVPPAFGIAPSTLQYNEPLCAPVSA